MYHYIVRQVIRNSFIKLNQGDYEGIFPLFAPNIHHVFAGEHALSGERQSINTVKLWYPRLFRLFPDIQFLVRDIFVKGWPWNTHAAVHFTVKIPVAGKHSYTNEVIQILNIRWGRIHSMSLHEDTQKLVGLLNHLHQQGVEEAVAAPIQG